MRKLSIDEMQQLAEKKGGTCLSSLYVGIHHKLEWQCKDGHRWYASPNSIKQGSWCPECAIDRRKGTLQEMIDLARIKGGQFLSKKYINSSTSLRWKCEQGHVWQATPAMIKQGTWCPKCYGMGKGIEEMQILAESRRGKCLSNKYVNAHTKLLWQCNAGHQWWAKPNTIQQGSWCSECAGKKRRSIEDLINAANRHDGKCLSQTYKTISHQYEWRCKKGHRWKASASNVIYGGYWCPYCANRVKKTIDDMQRLAVDRNGKCLSGNYINNKTKLQWQCAHEHKWFANPNSVLRGSWCPICAAIKKRKQIFLEQSI